MSDTSAMRDQSYQVPALQNLETEPDQIWTGTGEQLPKKVLMPGTAHSAADAVDEADHCVADGRWEFMLVSVPLHLTSGFTSPTNAVAIK